MRSKAFQIRPIVVLDNPENLAIDARDQCAGGRYALVNPCNGGTLESFQTLAEAKKWHGMRSEHCGFHCFPNHDHQVYDLDNLAKGPLDV